MKQRYVFTVLIAGDGETQEEAWIDAVEHFQDDPGGYSPCDDVDVEPLDS